MIYDFGWGLQYRSYNSMIYNKPWINIIFFIHFFIRSFCFVLFRFISCSLNEVCCRYFHLIRYLGLGGWVWFVCCSFLKKNFFGNFGNFGWYTGGWMGVSVSVRCLVMMVVVVDGCGVVWFCLNWIELNWNE